MASEIRGIEEVNRRLKAEIGKIGGPMTERFVTEVLIVAGGYAASYTPIATSALINSQYRRTWQAQNAWLGELGYGAKYATFVHEAPGTLLGTNTPRHPARLGAVWGPNGQPKFLEKGVEEMLQNDLAGIIERSFKL